DGRHRLKRDAERWFPSFHHLALGSSVRLTTTGSVRRNRPSARYPMTRRTSYLEHLARVPLFSYCTKQELQRLARRTTDITIDPGQAIIKEGRTGFEFFVIVDGKAEVLRKGKAVGQLGP